MEPFTRLTAIAAPLPLENVDTDKIIPARFMKTIRRQGLGKNLFDGLRYDAGGERPEFVLNQPPFRDAGILIAFENFGCGSSREHAPWALLDFGIRCIIAPSFADIFHNNCFKNGILPICLPRERCEELMAQAALGPNARMTIDLERQTVTGPDGAAIGFAVDAYKKSLLLAGLDDIGLTLRHRDDIARFEQARADDGWLYPAIDVVS